VPQRAAARHRVGAGDAHSVSRELLAPPPRRDRASGLRVVPRRDARSARAHGRRADPADHDDLSVVSPPRGRRRRLRGVSPLMASSLNRRDFLTYSGATVAGLTLGEAGRRWLARADERAVDFRPRDGVETFAASVCRECPAGCSLRVRSIDGTPVKIDGNPNCPIARGRLCAKGQASLEAYFDPDRLVGPAKRIGARGENRWAPIAWTDAVALLASHLTTAPAPGAVVAVSADERGPIADAWAAFWTAHHARLAWTIPPTAERFAPAFRALTGTG